MVRILTKDYTELDLTKGFEFQLELDNPILEDDHLPQAFSTQISFPPSPTNRKVFGYLPAMFLAPSVQALDVTVWVGGVPFVSGSLAYDGIEGGNLMYTFTQRIPDLDGKIWAAPIEEFSYRDGVPKSSTKFATPLLINEANVAVQPYSKISRRPVEGEPDYSATSADGTVDEDDYLYRQKYFNYSNASEGFGYFTFIPAVPIRVILAGIDVNVPVSLLQPENAPGELAILGRYHEYLFEDVVKPSPSVRRSSGFGSSTNGKRQTYSSGTGRPSRTSESGISNYKTDIASFLPDITFSDLVKNLCAILPQFLLGLLLKWWYSRGAEVAEGEYGGVKVLYSSRMSAGISLGLLVILPYKYARLRKVNIFVERTHAHEYGHCVQSRKLGWIYLPVIGLPSLAWNWAHSTFDSLQTVDYYSFWAERWADSLGGVER